MVILKAALQGELSLWGGGGAVGVDWEMVMGYAGTSEPAAAGKQVGRSASASRCGPWRTADAPRGSRS